MDMADSNDLAWSLPTPAGRPATRQQGAVAALAHVLGRGDANPSLASQVQKYPGIRGSGLGEQP